MRCKKANGVRTSGEAKQLRKQIDAWADISSSRRQAPQRIYVTRVICLMHKIMQPKLAVNTLFSRKHLLLILFEINAGSLGHLTTLGLSKHS